MTSKKSYTKAVIEIIELDLTVVTTDSEIRTPEIED